MNIRCFSPLFVLFLCTGGPAPVSAQSDTIVLPVQTQTVCAGEELTARRTGTAYAWSTGATTLSIPPFASGLYTVTITSANDSVFIDRRDVSLLIVPDPVLPVALTPPPYCPGQEVIFTVDLAGYDSLEWRQWNGLLSEPLAGFGASNDSVRLALRPGVGLNYVADYSPCNTQLSVLPPLQFGEELFGGGLDARLTGLPDTALCPGNPFTVSVVGERIAEVLWSDGDTSRTRSIVADVFDLTVDVFSDCDTMTTLTAGISVRDCPTETPDCRVFFPEVITPNGDGTNDFFRLFTAQDCPPTAFDLRIFNRWGQEVYRSSDPAASWDGTRNGTPQNMDIYLYTARFQPPETTVPVDTSGQFSLIR